MKKALFGVASLVVVSTAGYGISAHFSEGLIAPGVTVRNIALGGLTREQAAFKIRAWWETEKVKPLQLVAEEIKGKLPALKPNDLGVTIDDQATVSQLPVDNLILSTASKIGGESTNLTFEPVFQSNGQKPVKLINAIKALAPVPVPARVVFVNGNIIQKPEVTGVELDLASLQDAVVTSLEKGESLELPFKKSEKTISDEQLKSINEVVSVFSTKFSARNTSRSSNIKLAASKINGAIFMPGERFSFNGQVGQRTLKGGFKLAGVYVNGQHDVGVGGGICQVSTTLYNAALFANLNIVRRSNHSLPVPYVPLGRDATVNWGAQDLAFENTTDAPIALSAVYEPGKLTFRVLGQKQDGLSVKIERTPLVAVSKGVKTIVDPKLAPGEKKVVEPGKSGYTCSTFRLVYVDGKLQKREPLGRSSYNGDVRVIAVGPAAVIPPSLVPPTIPQQG